MLLILFIVGLTACTSAETTPLTLSPTPAPISAEASPTAQATETAVPTAPTAEPTPTDIPFSPPPLAYLQAAVDAALSDFDGVASYAVVDLVSGERIDHNPDVAIAGTSLVKIPLLVETYRALDNPPDIEQTKLITQTTALSSNFAANLLLRDVVGNGDIFAGADKLTASMRNAGLYNTFIAVPYDMEPPPGRLNTYLTPANQRTDITTLPDAYRQTTVGDLTLILEEIYRCADAGLGRLRELYPATLTQAECVEILEMMKLNELVKLLEAGVPEGVAIAHKIGYIDDTYGDAAIVFAPQQDYLLVLALYKPAYLEWAESSPLYAEISRLAYAHFNEMDAYSAETLSQPPAITPVAPVPTPEFPQAIVFGTQGIGLTLRSLPAGSELAILPDGSVVGLLPTEPISQGGVNWRHVVSAEGQEGWVGADYLVTESAK